jgi:hypothetical protein
MDTATVRTEDIAYVLGSLQTRIYDPAGNLRKAGDPHTVQPATRDKELAPRDDTRGLILPVHNAIITMAPNHSQERAVSVRVGTAKTATRFMPLCLARVGNQRARPPVLDQHYQEDGGAYLIQGLQIGQGRDADNSGKIEDMIGSPSLRTER